MEFREGAFDFQTSQQNPLKQREINRRTYHSIQEVQLSCFEYIEQFYNNYNPHSANNGLTPNQKEENYFKKI